MEEKKSNKPKGIQIQFLLDLRHYCDYLFWYSNYECQHKYPRNKLARI